MSTRIPPPVVRPPPPPTLDLLQTSKADLTTAACDVLTAWSAVGKAVVHASTSSDMAHKTIKSFVAVDDALERTSANMQRSLAEMTLLLRGTVETHKLLQVSICDVHWSIHSDIGARSTAGSPASDSNNGSSSSRNRGSGRRSSAITSNRSSPSRT